MQYGNKKMRILFFLHLPIPSSHAAWRRIEVFAECFKDEGHQVAIAGAFSPKSLSKAGSIRWRGIRIINVTPIVNTPNTVTLIFNILSSVLTSFVLLILLRPQMIIISVPLGETALGSYMIGKLFRRKIVIDYRDEWEDFIINGANLGINQRSYRTLKNVMTRCYLSCDLVVTVTEGLARSLSSRGVKNVKIVTNGADSSVFKPYDKDITRTKIRFNQGEFIFVYSGTLGSYYYRPLDIVFRALKKLISRVHNIKIIIVGEGPYYKAILNLSKEIGIQNNTFYLGARTDKVELAEILSAADVGIIPLDANPHWKNTLPAKAFEYFACGLPVVATVYKDSALGKLINENKIGLISDPEDVDALADIMEKIYSDALFRKDAGKRAVLLVQERYDRRKTAKQFLSLLNVK
jgi:glycosyltransferase involved in cell wall biosynthesis